MIEITYLTENDYDTYEYESRLCARIDQNVTLDGAL